MHGLEPQPVEPLYEIMAELHRTRNEFTEKSNASQNSTDMLCATALSIAICRVMIVLKDVLPEAVHGALHERIHSELPLVFFR